MTPEEYANLQTGDAILFGTKGIKYFVVRKFDGVIVIAYGSDWYTWVSPIYCQVCVPGQPDPPATPPTIDMLAHHEITTLIRSFPVIRKRHPE